MKSRNDYLSARATSLRVLIIQTLEATPEGYLMRESVLLSSLRHTQVPEVTEAELTQALEWLEAEALVYIHRDVLAGRSLSLSPKGRARAASL